MQATPLRVFADAALPSLDLDTRATNARRYSVQSGSLPPGLTLDQSSGKIAGVPTRPGQFASVISVQQDDTVLLHAPLQLQVTELPLQYPVGSAHELALTAGAVTTGVTPTSLQFADGVSAHFAVLDAASLPTGLSIDPNTGRISGTPTQTGLFDIKVGMTLQYLNKTRTYMASVPCWVKASGATSSGGVRG